MAIPSIQVSVHRPADRDVTEVYVFRMSDRIVDKGGGYVGHEREVLSPKGNWVVVPPMCTAVPTLVICGMSIAEPYRNGGMDRVAMDLATRVTGLLNQPQPVLNTRVDL